jgi:5'-deoxynucleotidase YfbR-like HD superfamily hydrolase
MGYKYIRTYTGREFYPMNPQPDAIDIRDIAHALSLVCRGNGHVNRFFSVAQHCINCAMEAEARDCSQRVILACLVHDASEAYMSDVPRPFKQVMPEYRAAEESLLELIYKTFLGEPLTGEEAERVKEIDDDLLYYDLKELLSEVQNRPAPQLNITLDYEVKPFQQVEEAYLKLYEKWRI